MLLQAHGAVIYLESTKLFYESFVTLSFSICFGFQAEIGRYLFSDREWEVYRFLLDENCKFQLSNMAARNQIVDRVRRTLMGW